MVTARDISDIKSFVRSPENANEGKKRLARMRQKYVEKNPMTMDEINSVIEGEKVIHNIFSLILQKHSSEK